MKIRKLLGIFILILIFAGLFIATAHFSEDGYLMATIVWGISFFLTGIIALAVYLIINN